MIKNKKIEMIVISVILILQSLMFIYFGANKSYLHMDEAYSLGLASYDKVEIQENEDFYDKWHTAEYYRDYLAVDEDEKWDLSPVYENQKNDVHPPLYYLLLRVFMGMSVGRFTMWGGVALNIIIHLFITVFTYLIAQKLLAGGGHVKEKAAILTLLSALTLSTLTSVLYIRMYALAALNILITVYLHIRLYENKEQPTKYCFAIGLIALIGSLTHYFYLYFIFAMFILFTVMYIERYEYKNLRAYILPFALAAVASLLIFPHSIKHMFFGYRGQGVISNLIDPEKYVNVFSFAWEINVSVFNYMMLVIVGVIFAIRAYNRMTNKEVRVCGNVRWAYIIIGFPTLFCFIITSVSSPWIELRYILPICVLIFITVMCYLYRALRTSSRNVVSNGVIIFLAAAMLLTPKLTDTKPAPLYADRAEAVEYIKENAEKPTVYFFSSNHDRFLDEIMMFSIIENSYIAYDVGADPEKIADIFEGMDTSNGVTIFVNEDFDDWEVAHAVREALGLEHADHLYRMNSCEIFKVYPAD